MAKEQLPQVELQPTPFVGWPLQWVERGPRADQEDAKYAATCTLIEAPGRIQVSVFPPNRQMFIVKGVRHMSDPEWAKNREGDFKAGGWQYLPGLENPGKFERHEQIIAKKRQQAELQAQQQAERDLKRKQQLAQLEAQKQSATP